MGDELDLSGDRGVLKTTIREAKTDAIGPTKDLPIVDVHYEISIDDTGYVFYNTREDKIYTFEAYSEVAIKGFDIAVRTMKVGEIASFRCEPNYGYGSAGCPPNIPPNAALYFEVELMACGPRRSAIPDSASSDAARLCRILRRRKERALAAAAREENEKKKKEMREAQVVGGEYWLTADGGVKKKFLRKAESDDAIGPSGDLRSIVVHHRFGVVVKETGETCIFNEGPILSFTIGMGFVIRGWDIALSTMKVGDVARITCEPKYAFGKEGSPPAVPPNATLICVLELMACLSWISRPIPSEEKEACQSWIREPIPLDEEEEKESPSKEEEERLEWEGEWAIELKRLREMSAEELLEQRGKGAQVVAAAARVRARLAAKKNQRKAE